MNAFGLLKENRTCTDTFINLMSVFKNTWLNLGKMRKETSVEIKFIVTAEM